MRNRARVVGIAMALLAGGYGTPRVEAAGVLARVGDVTRVKGQRTNTLVGMGLVTGLNGTGDGDDYLPSMRPLAAALGQFANATSVDELGGTKNVAVVMLEAVLPENGVREGESLDVQVTTIGSSESLRGGRLLITPLLYHDRAVQQVFAYASGPIQLLSEDDQTFGVIRGGATMESDVLLHFLAYGRELPFTANWIEASRQYVTLVIDAQHAGWAMSHEIATALNTELAIQADVERVAMAMDPANVIVLMPEGQDVADWMRLVEGKQLLMPEERARVVVDRRSGTIVVSGDARISPVLISQRGLTINIAPPTEEGEKPRMPTIPGHFLPLDPSDAAETHLTDLLEALKPLDVPIEDRIEILSKLDRIGKLHAELVYED